MSSVAASLYGTPLTAADQTRFKADRVLAALDEMIAAQVDAICRHPRFRRLEAAWRGLCYLAEAADRSTGVKIRMLHMTWAEIGRDLERAAEFDQSQLFQKIYEQEFGMPGGEPYGLLIGDYEVSHKRSAEHPTDDVSILSGVAQVAAAAFAPFMVGAAPELLGMESFTDLGLPVDLARAVSGPEFERWRSLRDLDDARFLGLTAPRILMRLPCPTMAAAPTASATARTSPPRFDGLLLGPRQLRLRRHADPRLRQLRLVRGDPWRLGPGRHRRTGDDLPQMSFGTDRDGVGLKIGTDVD
jgi:type VI secretion system ImpC/EvpB family protein